MNGVRQLILYSVALDQPPGRKTYKEPKLELFKRVNKSVLSQITSHLEDKNHKPVEFNKTTIFTSQLI